MLARHVFSAYARESAVEAPPYLYCPHCGTKLRPSDPTPCPHQLCEACGRFLYRNPSPGVVVLIPEGERVLLVERAARSAFGSRWCLPGGYVEFSEDYLSAAIREVKEETSLKVEICSILSVVSNFLTPRLHTLVAVLRARVLEGSLHAGDDAVDARWYSPDDLPPLAFEADGHIIRRYFGTDLPGLATDPAFSTPRQG